MRGKSTPLSEQRPYLERCMRIAHDHILYAQANPNQLQSIAARLRVSADAALAFVIADQITEEFHLTENLD